MLCCKLAARSSSPVTAGLCHPKYLQKIFCCCCYKEARKHRHKGKGQVRGSQNALPCHTISPALFLVMSLPLFPYPGKRDLTRDRTGSSNQISSSEPLISQHSMSGYEEPGVSILLEMAGFEFRVCILQTPTRKRPKGLRHTPSISLPSHRPHGR